MPGTAQRYAPHLNGNWPTLQVRAVLYNKNHAT